MTLEVRQWNRAAQQLYRALGFTEVGIHNRYYRDRGEDAHLLTRFGLDVGKIWRSLAVHLQTCRDIFLAEANSDDAPGESLAGV